MEEVQDKKDSKDQKPLKVTIKEFDQLDKFLKDTNNDFLK